MFFVYAQVCYHVCMLVNQVKTFFETYERLLMPTTLLFGTIVDFITFRTLNIETTFLILGVYLLLCVLCIVVLNTKQHDRVRIAAKFLIQFTFGALLSSSFVFYWFSGAFSVSWPILALVVVLMISNESFRHFYLKPIVQLSIFYFVLFSFLTLLFPFLVHSVEPIWFYVIGDVSFATMFLFVMILAKYIESIRRVRVHVLFSSILILVFMNLFYVLDVIPPIPLSLREAGVYHSVVRSGAGYQTHAEKESLLDRVMPGQTIHITSSNRRVFVFASIFAPTDLNTTIVHEWNFYDETKKKWVVKDELTYHISGGREDGYRGYSNKSSVEPGKWRVDVQTKKGQTLGRVRFDVKEVESTPNLIEEVK